MIPSTKGLGFIAEREALRLSAYKDEAGVWTIAYGSLHMPDGEPVKRGDSIDVHEAVAMLDDEIHRMGAKLELIVKPVRKLKQCQIDALLSFVYNIGVQAFRTSTLLKLLNSRTAPTEAQIRNQFMRWNKVHRDGQLITSKGLTRRRKLEADMFFSC